MVFIPKVWDLVLRILNWKNRLYCAALTIKLTGVESYSLLLRLVEI